MNKMRLLLVDDHQIVLDGLRALLRDETGYEVVAEAANGQEALRLVEILKPDIILMDIDMPIMNGIEATTAIKRLSQNKKVIILTMHEEQSLVRRLMQIGANGYLFKNTNQSTLLSALEAVSKGIDYFPEEVLSVKGHKRDSYPEASGKDVVLLSELTEREIEVLRFIAEGMTNKEVADRLSISHRTVDTHRTHLMKKLEATNIAALVKFAYRNGLISSE